MIIHSLCYYLAPYDTLNKYVDFNCVLNLKQLIIIIIHEYKDSVR